MKLNDLLKSKTQTMMFDRFNSDTEKVIPVSDVKEIVKSCMKAQRKKCADDIKDWNLALSEMVRVADEPTDIDIE
jgi:hypothetical protein